MAKHLVDIDEEMLSQARAALGTATIKDTVNQALHLASSQRERQVAVALDVLGTLDLDDRDAAWR